MNEYLSYKECNISWLGTIPEHWQTKRAKYLFTRLDRPVEPHYEVITCFRDGVVTLRKNRRETGFTESLTETGYQGIKKGDLVIHQMDAFAGSVGVSDSDGKSTPVYSICSPKEKLSPHYYAYIIREMARTNYILSLSKGIRQRSTDFRFPTFARCILPVPPVEEQNTIVAYLDKKCAEIEELISRRQSIIERLRELKQSIIAEAVTKGLNPDVPMRDSGIAWLGEVPQHWEKFRNKNELFPKVNHVGKNPDKLPMLSLTKKGVIVRDLESGKGKFSADESKFLIVEPGDFVFCHYDIQETPRTVGLSAHHGYITGSYNIYGYKGLNSRFFYYLHEYFDDGKLLCPLYKGLRNTIRQDRFLSMRIVLPPPEEQNTIVAYLDKKCAEIDELVAWQEQIIGKLKELKTTTIAHVVTGKVDVRDAI